VRFSQKLGSKQSGNRRADDDNWVTLIDPNHVHTRRAARYRPSQQEGDRKIRAL
jgi:hypothetical protein